MPDDPRFRIPSDFLGVAGFEFYTDQTLDAVAKKVPERLQAAFTAGGFKPPSLQERCRRLLLLSGWMRGEIAKIRLELPGGALKEQVGEKIGGVLCFLKEDIDMLGLREDANALEELVRKSLDDFPHVPDRGEVEYRLRKDVRDFLSQPKHYRSQIRDDRFYYRLGLFDLLGPEGRAFFDYDRYDRRGLGCPWCDRSGRIGCEHPFHEGRPYTPYMHNWGMPIRGSHYQYVDGIDVHCLGHAYHMGALDMLALLYDRLGEFDHTISSLERWQQAWVPDILDRLGAMEQKVHKQIFGHL
jgi:hypothetical protein